jgi:magnesium-transporting ATPase (P-type)
VSGAAPTPCDDDDADADADPLTSSPPTPSRRLQRFGPNALTPPKTLPWYVKLALKFADPFMILLEVSQRPAFTTNHQHEP